MSELLGADTEVLDRNAESLSADSRRAQDICSLVQRAVAELQGSWNGVDLRRLTQQWEQQTSPMMAQVSASLDTCASQLRWQSAAQRLASSVEGGGSPAAPIPDPTPDPRLPASPPGGGSPGGAATWWRSLNPQQQQEVVTEHPDWIGSRDGVPFAARDLANRALLSIDKARLVADREHLQSLSEALNVAPADSLSGSVLRQDSEAVGRIEAKLASIDAVEAALAQPGEHQLLLLDLAASRAQAAIAAGNVDTADDVAVLVPGLSATVGGGMVLGAKDLANLRSQIELESRRAHTYRSAATVMWMGYQAPQMGWDLVGRNSVADELSARHGAAQLVPFLQGIGAARDKDAHLTLLGHSYGTTAAGLALRQSTGVDDAVFFGSPGLGTSHLDDLRLAPGHAFYIEADWDGVGDLGRFGIDPSHLAGIEHASARASTVVDPQTGQTRHLSEVTGHSAYLLDQSTSQYNMSVIAAGLPDRRVRDAGEGLGDVLSWPMPGTY